MTDTSPATHVPTLMTVHAHPDDEVIGTGGVMAKSIKQGRRVVLATASAGHQTAAGGGRRAGLDSVVALDVKQLVRVIPRHRSAFVFRVSDLRLAPTRLHILTKRRILHRIPGQRLGRS